MNHFIRKFSVEGGDHLELYFSRIYTDDGEAYMVTTMDGQSHFHLFHMVSNEESWKIDRSKPHIAKWILELEHELSTAIRSCGQ